MLTVTRLLKPVIVTSHLLGGMTTLALLAVLAAARTPPARPSPGGLRLLAGAALADGGRADRPRRLGQQQLRRRDLRRFPTCQGSWWPEMDTTTPSPSTGSSAPPPAAPAAEPPR
jgi:cytochrome c oxidase assembly protein subunit 15